MDLGDIKCANILITLPSERCKHGSAKLADFGCSKQLAVIEFLQLLFLQYPNPGLLYLQYVENNIIYCTLFFIYIYIYTVY